ncbi:MAG: serine hydroxymethyltransferase [Deltaproteobacteria bacterium]|nr:serine hydroxymethyltransferase [Deltaproteobacteria bacterium]
MSLHTIDSQIAKAIDAETERQRDNLLMIASENYASQAVMDIQGSVLTNKYAEGYPGARYYAGCKNVDIVENLAVERAKKLFKAEFANVQPHSGSQANMAIYFSFLSPGDTIMGMDLAHGGHLSHGSNINFSGKIYKAVFYGVDPQTHRIDLDQVKSLARSFQPKLIIAGASSYPRIIDFRPFKQIAEDTGAYLLADIAHVAGLIAGGQHPSPFPFADFVTSTTHKTLRGPRGGLILAKKKYAKQIDAQIFPGIQGGPFMHVIAAKAVAFKQAMTPEFADYQRQIVSNARVLAEELLTHGLELISGGTDNHIVIINLNKNDLTGIDAENALEHAGIVVNKNSVPFDKKGPSVTSGIRLGTPALTTRGMKEREMKKVAKWITRVLERPYDKGVLTDVRSLVHSLCRQFPLY